MTDRRSAAACGAWAGLTTSYQTVSGGFMTCLSLGSRRICGPVIDRETPTQAARSGTSRARLAVFKIVSGSRSACPVPRMMSVCSLASPGFIPRIPRRVLHTESGCMRTRHVSCLRPWQAGCLAVGQVSHQAGSGLPAGPAASCNMGRGSCGSWLRTGTRKRSRPASTW